MLTLRGWVSFAPRTKDFLQDLLEQDSKQNAKQMNPEEILFVIQNGRCELVELNLIKRISR